MNCSDFEILLAEYIDGTLREEQRSAMEAHRHSCASCAELARDSAEAVAFLDHVPSPVPPPELIPRILQEIAASHEPSRWGAARKWIRRWLEPVLEPRLAMGMAMTMLSLTMLGRFSSVELRQLKPSDLNPANLWSVAEDHANRAWERTVKNYENMRVVFEIQAQMKEWDDQRAEVEAQ